ncbi:hypothetical protein [Desulfovirgula thermocuniculi]|uniref:hypothetical protein n=1 Tax=Desulfovirgula thermocuniculi TaxID=348842 RepID=UPI00040BC50C|nr:hypothetical protein [Desulfovirgula thermocuniculi]
MLKHYCDLLEELSSLEKSVISELTIEEITRYVELRRRREELAGSLRDLITDALLQLQDLAERIGEELLELPEMMENVRQEGEAFLHRLAGVIGALQTDMERILADCRQLRYELLWGGANGACEVAREEQGEALEEAACAREVEGDEREKQEKPGGTVISPETIKKLENAMRPKVTMELEPSLTVMHIEHKPKLQKPQKTGNRR